MGWYGGSGGGGTLSDPPYTIEGNPTSATANTTAFTIGSLTAKTVPASTDQLMLQDNAASGALKSVPWSSMPGAGGGMSIGGAVTGGTAGSVLFVGSGPVLAQDNANFSWTDSTQVLQTTASLLEYINVAQCVMPTTNSIGSVAGLLDGLWGLTYANTTPGSFIDNCTRANTALGTIGNGWTCYGPYVSGYPLPAATGGQILSNQFVAAVNTIVYAERDMVGKNVMLQATASWATGSGSPTDAATLAMISSSSVNFIDTMIHLTVNRSSWVLDKRLSGGSFTTLTSGSFGPTLSLNTSYVFEVAYYNTTAYVYMNGTLLGSATDTDIPASIGRYALFEIYHPSANMIDLVSISNMSIITLASGSNALTWNNSGLVTIPGSELDISTSPTLVKTGPGILLYQDGTGSHYNFFAGGGGNTGVTAAGGASNVGMGVNALHNVGSGVNNVAVGVAALNNVTSGQNNFGLGTSSLANITVTSNNIGIGNNALNALNDTTNAGGNVGIGANAGNSFTAGNNNVFIGVVAGNSFTTAFSNICIGPYAGQQVTSGNYNTLIGGWAGPAGSISNVIALSDGNANLRLDYNYTTASVWTFPAEVDLAAGTATVTPLKFKSGANLTTAAAGACEFDGTAFYQTAVASARQVATNVQLQTLSANRTFTSNTSAQAIFNATANGTITVAASTTYEFEMFVNATGFSSSAHTINLGFGGTATYTSIGYFYDAQTGSAAATPTAALSGFIATNAASAICASSTTTGLILRTRGYMRINAAGTVIPQLTQVTASAAAVVQANSFFRCWPIGSNTVTNVGNWS